MGSHQSHWLNQPWEKSGFAERLLQKHFAIKCPVLRTNIRKTNIGFKMTACDPAKPHRHIRKLGKPLCFFRVSNEARRIDDDAPTIQLRMQNIGEHFGGWR